MEEPLDSSPQTVRTIQRVSDPKDHLRRRAVKHTAHDLAKVFLLKVILRKSMTSTTALSAKDLGNKAKETNLIEKTCQVKRSLLLKSVIWDTLSAI